MDLRDDVALMEKLAKTKQKPVSLEQGEKLAKELKAVKYVECSALTQVSIQFYSPQLLCRFIQLDIPFWRLLAYYGVLIILKCYTHIL